MARVRLAGWKFKPLYFFIWKIKHVNGGIVDISLKSVTIQYIKSGIIKCMKMHVIQLYYLNLYWWAGTGNSIARNWLTKRFNVHVDILTFLGSTRGGGIKSKSWNVWCSMGLQKALEYVNTRCHYLSNKTKQWSHTKNVCFTTDESVT